MLNSYDRRLSALEQQTLAKREPMRIIRMIITPEREVVGANVRGRHFERVAGESEAELVRMVELALGWTTP